MGYFGTEEHQNDDFLDYIEDTNDPDLLLKYIKTASGGNIVGIFNLLKPSDRNKIAGSIIQKGISYLQNELNSEENYPQSSEWSNVDKRIASIKLQLTRMQQYASRKRTQSKSNTRSRSKSKKRTRSKSRQRSR